MPELPEVETVRKGLHTHITSKKLRALTVRNKNLRWEIPIKQIPRLKNKICERIERRGKYILMFFNGKDAPVALVHLGMSGRLFLDSLRKENTHIEWEKHENWRMDFGQKQLRFFDPRRFGMLDIVTPKREITKHHLLHKLGPEPLGSSFNSDYLFQQSRNRLVTTKDFLMNAQIVTGIGNIYASEICFHARINPQRPVGKIKKEDARLLVESARKTLLKAINCRGTTLKDFCDINRNPGTFQKHLFVYGRAGQPCFICENEIQKVILGQRSSFYCPQCQV